MQRLLYIFRLMNQSREILVFWAVCNFVLWCITSYVGVATDELWLLWKGINGLFLFLLQSNCFYITLTFLRDRKPLKTRLEEIYWMHAAAIIWTIISGILTLRLLVACIDSLMTSTDDVTESLVIVFLYLGSAFVGSYMSDSSGKGT